MAIFILTLDRPKPSRTATSAGEYQRGVRWAGSCRHPRTQLVGEFLPADPAAFPALHDQCSELRH
ncbi:hypothetical protein AWW66_24220 [Micromonospora rosaria]|uniref:Uncharacterized protein n=1 Tax=Micromonospora rosaria TaxID=47874 RepID=A0A136PM35_9ACTN|nr:hypothetical protein AWW66_24220 [Micromonospora rosaria]